MFESSIGGPVFRPMTVTRTRTATPQTIDSKDLLRLLRLCVYVHERGNGYTSLTTTLSRVPVEKLGNGFLLETAETTETALPGAPKGLNRPSPKPRLNYLGLTERKLLISQQLSLQGVSLTTRSATCAESRATLWTRFAFPRKEKPEPELSYAIPKLRDPEAAALEVTRWKTPKQAKIGHPKTTEQDKTRPRLRRRGSVSG